MSKSPWLSLSTPDLDTLTKVTRDYAGIGSDLIESVDQAVNAAMGGLASIQPSFDLATTIQDQLNVLSLGSFSSQVGHTSFLTDINSQIAQNMAAMGSPSFLTDINSQIAQNVAAMGSFGLQEELDQLSNAPLDRMLEIANAQEAQLSKIAEHFRFTLDPLRVPTFGSAAHETLLESVRAATTYLSSLGDDAFTIDDDGEVSFNNELIDREDLQAALSEATAQAQDEQTPEGLVAFILRTVEQARKNPVVTAALRIILLQVLVPFLVSVLANVAYNNFKQPQVKPRSIQRQVSQAAQQLDADPKILKTLRIILKHDLPVFYDAERKSGHFTRLPAGQVVSFLHRKRRSWAHVEWRTDDGHYHGWVLTRYLGRIEPERVVKRRRKHEPLEWSCD